MGYNQYLFEVKKVPQKILDRYSTVESIPFMTECISDLGKDDYKGLDALFKADLPTIKTLRGAKITTEKIKEKYGIPPEAYPKGSKFFAGYSCLNFVWKRKEPETGEVQEFSKELKISDEELLKCCQMVEEDYYVFDLKFLAQWQKNYQIDDYFRSKYDILNGGYIPVSEEDIAHIKELDPEFSVEWRPNLFYVTFL